MGTWHKRLISLSTSLVLTMSGVGLAGASTQAPQKLSESANLHVETAAVGQIITVTLHSTFWRFVKPSTSKLQQVGAEVRHIAPRSGPGSCFPGMGCGTVIVNYRALHRGTVVVSASRTMCGEVITCTKARSRWSATIVIR